MSKGNRDAELVRAIEEARALLDIALGLAKGERTAREPKLTESKKRDGTRESGDAQSVEFDFSMPLRAFAKKHAPGKSGPKKFALLLAYLAKGEAGKAVPLEEVVKNWNSMTGLLGAYNHAHPLRAREADAVESKEGAYCLRPGWKERV